ncbi:type IV secretion protein Rhs [Cupriavidus necator]|uniref:Type IV secretion protein Rhs n=1 Tax=Cupriavidus necator TaxID=106590 RepID=A0A1U9UPG4_CUPNE|nr:type VI secretion system Vgr family protein [Cupriavidus necator]AQV94469.1 type IV secretion protein Rhs [Cupriavidus necator]
MADLTGELKNYGGTLLKGLTGGQAYFVEVPGTASAAALSVVSFEAVERMGEPYTVTIQLTHPLELDRADYLGKAATFLIDTADGTEPRKFAGWITRFSKTRQTHDFCSYEIVMEPLVARLRLTRASRIYQHRTAPQIIEAILRRHGLQGHQFAFRLRRKYPQHKFRLQHRMSDLAYVRLLCEQEGIYFYFSLGKFGEMVVFGDDIDHYIYQPELRVPYRESAGLESGQEAVFSLETHAKTVPESFRVADFNPDQAWERPTGEANVARKEKTTYGQSYVYGTHHLDFEGAKWEAQLRHESKFAEQLIFAGESNVLELRPARILRMDQALPDAPNGQVITEVIHSGARDAAYRNTFKAIPSDRRYRLPTDEDNWPRIHGTLSARITSPGQYKYAYLTQHGHYTVRFDVDFEEWPKGAESVPLALAKPFAGALQTGFHFPLIDGTYVDVAFRDGNPNKPYIAHVQHNSQHADLITNQEGWLSRNVIRTQSNNKLRMEDWAGQESIKLSTEYAGKSQLNLGYLVDHRKKKRGDGFELRTSGWGAIRGGKGLFLSADDQPNAAGQQLEMQAALRLLEQAIQQSEALAEAAKAAQAMAADCERQKALLHDTLNQLKAAGLLASAPAGMALVSGADLQLSANKNLIATAGGNADISVLRQLAVAAGNGLSLFVQKLGMKLFAARGKVEIQAQSDEMHLTALKDLKIVSVDGKLILSADKEVWLGAGGSYIRITPEGIENGTQGDIREKCAAWDKQGAASMQVSTNLSSGLPTQPLMLNAAASPASRNRLPAGTPYRLLADGVLVKQGVMDATGLIPVDHHVTTHAYQLELAGGASYAVPVAEEYRGDPANGELANRGFQLHESRPSGEVTPPGDRALHRQRYQDLLNPESEG